MFSSCNGEKKQPKLEYNEKANELIQQLIQEGNCNCILEIPLETTMEFQKLEMRSFNSETYYGKKLSKKNIKELDSLSKIAQNFKLDTKFISDNNIKIIKRDSLKFSYKDFNLYMKICKNGITYFTKPNFNKNFDIAIINYGESGMCLPTPAKIYEYKNNEWKIKTADNTRL